MDSPHLLRQLLRTPPTTYLPFLSTPTIARTKPHTLQTLTHTQSRRQLSTTSLPRILQPQIWAALIPKPLRKTAPSTDSPPPKKKKRSNPATPFIILSLLVGSQAIQTIWLKREKTHYINRTDAKIGVLREVVERVQRGEDIDVEKVLGTGDGMGELEWKNALKGIEGEEALYLSRKGRRAEREGKGGGQEEKKVGDGERGLEELERRSRGDEEKKRGGEGVVKVVQVGGARFY